jgi:sugar lactone lactonase YvrE
MRVIGGADLLIDSRNEVGEGPLWDDRRNALLWLDVLAGHVHRYSLSTRVHEHWEIGQPVGCLSLDRSGRIVMGMRDGFAELDTASGANSLFAPVELDRTDQRMNDGKCDALGRIWAGTMGLADPVQGSGSLYRLDLDGSVTSMLTGLTISNGIGWSPDDTIMYFVDTATERLDAFDFDLAAGTISNRRTLASVPRGVASLDGLAVDESGCVWVALWGVGEVRCYAPDGEQIATLEVPVSASSSCAFGGHDLSTLFVTTARLNLTDKELADQPTSGGVYAADVGVRGLPVMRSAH